MMRINFNYLLKAIIWLLFFLLGTEIFLRIFVISPLNSSYVLHGGGIEVYGYEGYGIVAYDSNMEILTSSNDGDENIIVLGDSYTEARQVPYWLNYSSIAENKLKEQGFQNINIRNFGYRDLSLADYLGMAPGLIQNYSPNIVVIQVTYQEFVIESFNRKDNGFFYLTEDVATSKVLLNREETTDDFVAKNNAYSKSRFYNIDFKTVSLDQALAVQKIELKPFDFFKKNDLDFWSEPEPNKIIKDKTKVEPSLALQNMRIVKVVEMLSAAYKDIPIIFIIIPSPSSRQGFSYSLNENELRIKEILEKHPNWYVLYPVSQFDDALKNGYIAHGFWNTVPMKGHMNMLGHEIIGTALAEKIKEIIK